MKIERRHFLEQAQLVKVVLSRQRRNFVRPLSRGGTQPVGIVHGNAEPFHQRARVLAEALLVRHERIAMVEVFHLTLFHIAGEADVMVRR